MYYCKKLKRNIEANNEILNKLYQSQSLDVDEIIHEYQEFDRKLDEYITDTSEYLNNALRQRKEFLPKAHKAHCWMWIMERIRM